ncbi:MULTISPECIES: SGNH/GDSL hydrolase family protein [unclassified Nocardioides]|uniref:SGNH/GDSL hydrolase family protein n=1 Tax=unclassified Nocardioides TaxID=2615069 RepID=UPI0006FDDEE0|nr:MULTISPECIES: SGNH/GDSL hydrolase family protein [unclassified Nocardioides]KQY57724.1 SGNH hydrolase [Nocardioides sp. Root140]KRF11973.1 SGNH hydrolase [Nocardioides sp. Soil796]
MTFQRYVALGDSFTEGVGDPDPARPNGLRGWADLVAEQLAVQDPDFTYANLAIRGRKLDGVLAEQIEPAVAMRPDLVTIYAGGNDMLRPKVDLNGLIRRYDDGLGKLAATGAHLVLWTAHDPSASRFYAPLRGRFAIYNELVRELADSYDATLIDFWRLREYQGWGLWSDDRLHMNSAGHQRMAIEVLNRLGITHALEVPDPAPAPVSVPRREALGANLRWTRTEALPWAHRRLTGRSSGDTVSPRRPELGPVE